MKNVTQVSTVANAMPPVQVGSVDGQILADIKRMNVQDYIYNAKKSTFSWKKAEFSFIKGTLQCENIVVFHEFMDILGTKTKFAGTVKMITLSIKELNAKIKAFKLQIAMDNGEDKFRIGMLSDETRLIIKQAEAKYKGAFAQALSK